MLRDLEKESFGRERERAGVVQGTQMTRASTADKLKTSEDLAQSEESICTADPVSPISILFRTNVRANV